MSERESDRKRARQKERERERRGGGGACAGADDGVGDGCHRLLLHVRELYFNSIEV